MYHLKLLGENRYKEIEFFETFLVKKAGFFRGKRDKVKKKVHRIASNQRLRNMSKFDEKKVIRNIFINLLHHS